jgi:hypothetical protein
VIPDQAGDDILLTEFNMDEHPQGGFTASEVIPTRADIV